MKVVEVWGTDSGAEDLPTSWGPLAFCLHSALFSSVCLFPHLLSQATQFWPVSLTICSCSCILLYQRQLFFIPPLLLLLTTWLFVSIHSFFLHLINISLSSGFFRYKCAFKASQCYFLLVCRIRQGMQIPSLFLMPFRPCWPLRGCRGGCEHHSLMPGPVLLPFSPLHLQIVNACSKCWNNFNYLMIHELISRIMEDKRVQ